MTKKSTGGLYDPFYIEDGIRILDRRKKPTTLRAGDVCIWEFRIKQGFYIMRDNKRLLIRDDKGNIAEQYGGLPIWPPTVFYKIMNLVAAVSGLKPEFRETAGIITCTFCEP